MLPTVIEPALPISSSTAIATTLCVKVVRGGITRVDLALPARVLERLGDLIDDEIRQRIQARGVDLDAIIASAQAGALHPRVLFADDNGQRNVEVSLR